MRRIESALVFAVTLLLCSPAHAEPATGFLVQGQIASNLMIAGLNAYGPSFSVMPSLRLGGQLRRLAIAAELNYSSFAALDGGNGTDTGLHLIAIGPHFQPIIWQSADRNARLAIACGFNLGAAVSTRSTNASSSSESWVTGGFNAALHGSYFLHPSFAVGFESGVRTQIVNADGDHIVVASLYVALSMTFVAGR
jgi:hypothetical protein